MTIMLDSVSFLFNLYFWIIVKHILENIWLTALVKMALDLEIRSDQISVGKLRVNLPLIEVRWVATVWTMRFQWTTYQWHQNATTCQIFIEPMCTSFEISRHFILTYWTWCTFWPYFRVTSAMILPWEHNTCHRCRNKLSFHMQNFFVTWSPTAHTSYLSQPSQPLVV